METEGPSTAISTVLLLHIKKIYIIIMIIKIYINNVCVSVFLMK